MRIGGYRFGVVGRSVDEPYEGSTPEGVRSGKPGLPYVLGGNAVGARGNIRAAISVSRGKGGC